MAINPLLEIPVGEQVVAPDGSASFLSVDGSGVAAEPQVVIAFDTEHEQLVEWGRALRRACPELRVHLVIVAAGLRQPSRLKRALAARKQGGGAGEHSSQIPLQGGTQRQAPLR